MRRFITILCLMVGLALSASAGTYKLTDGNVLSGEPISFDQNGVVIKSGDNSFSPRTSYDKFTQEGLRELMATAKRESDKAYVEPLIEEPEQAKAQRKAIVIKPVAAPERPTKGIGMFAAFTSPVGIVIFLILYGATIYAAYEVALFRNQPFGTVCGLAAIPFFGILSPIIFVSMPTRMVYAEEEAQPMSAAVGPPMAAAPEPASAPGSNFMAARMAQAAPEQLAPSQPSIPAPLIFARGEFSFNRRFFETKLAGFLRVVPGPAEKDMLVFIKSVRGDFVGRRVVRINPADLTLQVFKDNATADEVIPFSDILEVQIRHKDLA